MSIYNLTKKGFSCSKCSDKISYPEKFMMSLLNQLDIKYIYQLSKKHFDWCKNFRYDFYLPDYNCIIETNGGQHYGKLINKNIDINYLISNDLEKKSEAIYQGIEFYEWIDCSYSTPEYIINSIQESNLCKILCFNIKDINVQKCDFDASKNILKEICDYFNNNENITPNMLSNIFHLSTPTIKTYLKRGTKLGLCNYSTIKMKEIGKQKVAKYIHETRSLQIEAFDKSGTSMGVFYNANSVSKYFKDKLNITIHVSNIGAVCLGRYKQAKGYTFKYISKEEYNNRQQEQKDLKT